MNSEELAKQLVATKTKHQRNRMIVNGVVSATDLARCLTDICVENWAAKPKVSQKAALIVRELAAQSKEPEIQGYAGWADGIADMTRGRLESAVENLHRSKKDFKKAGKIYESAQPQIAALVALAILGRYDQIPPLGRRALRILEKHGDQLSAGKVEINLTNIAFQLGRYRQAEELGLSALGRFKKLKASAWAAMVENGLANTYAALNDFRSAEKFFRAALKSARSTGKIVTEAETEASIGNLAFSRGRYAEALQFLELSRKKFDELEMPHKSAIADLEIAEIYSELNLSEEALDLLSRIVAKLSRLKMQSEEARARFVLGKTAIRQKKTAFARKELEKASRLYGRERNRTKKAVVMIHQALLELQVGRVDQARNFAKKAEAVFKKTGNTRDELMASWVLGEVLAKTGKTAAAISKLHKTSTDALRFEQKQVALLSLNSAGATQLQIGNFRGAEKAFTQAVNITEASRALLPSEEFRIAFLDGKLNPFHDLAKIALAQNRIGDAFGFIERAKSRSLLETMNGSLDSVGRMNGYSSQTGRLREELNWFYDRSRKVSANDSAKLQAEIVHRERRLSDLLRREQSLSRSVTTKRKRRNMEIDLARLSNTLGPAKALIEYVNFDGKLSAFVITSDGVQLVPKLTTEKRVTEELEHLRFQFEALRYGRPALSSFADQMKQRADQVLARLYGMLISRLESAIGDRDVIVVPSGNIHYVPFSALRDDSSYLIESRKISIAPSASVWQALRLRAKSKLDNPMLIAFADDAAPEVENEVRAISRMLPQATVFAGKDATFSNFQNNAERHDLIHIACHGSFRADSPLFSSLQLVDGSINVRDISSLRLKTELVVLSACETGLNKVYPGDEIVGLARGFLLAGARSLVLSLWTVNDEATKHFMMEFYSQLQRGNPADASIRQAQIKFLEKGEHPYYWSSFFYVG